MKRPLTKLRYTAIVLFVLCLAGLGVDYMVNDGDIPDMYTLIPLCMLIVVLLIMAVTVVYNVMIQQDR
ncbi:MAG: hypothetical protein H6551_11085 [Chitinophagales bacterium]|nr:hypothetical protein [Chitinophagaceae bacterium]MCB9065669.1 hypothetical protein [Chitinophagales bacterium]